MDAIKQAWEELPEPGSMTLDERLAELNWLLDLNNELTRNMPPPIRKKRISALLGYHVTLVETLDDQRWSLAERIEEHSMIPFRR